MTCFLTAQRIPYCCGVWEIGNFSSDHEDEDNYFEEYELEEWETVFGGDSWQEALESLEKHIKERTFNYSNRPGSQLVVQAWFVSHTDYRGNVTGKFDEQELKDLVEKLPGVVHLHEGINVNSTNLISGYLWKYTKE